MEEGGIEKQLNQLRKLYAQLFILMQRYQASATEKTVQSEDLAGMNAEIARRMQVADSLLRELFCMMGNSADPLVTDFLDMLDAGLNSMKNQINYRMARIHHEQKDLARSIRLQQKKRFAIRSAKD